MFAAPLLKTGQQQSGLHLKPRVEDAPFVQQVRANKAAMIALLAAPIVTAVALAHLPSLGLIPDAPAIAPPDAADRHTAALAAAVAAPAPA